MLDAILSRTAGPYVTSVGARLPTVVSATALKAAAFIAGTAALPAIGYHKYWLALALLILRAVLDVLAGAVRHTSTEGGVALDRMLDLVLGAAIPFAFALAMSERALAAMFLLLGLVVRAGAAGTTGDDQQMIGKTELFLAFGLACIFPDRFSIIAYVVGVLCFVGAGQRLARVVSS